MPLTVALVDDDAAMRERVQQAVADADADADEVELIGAFADARSALAFLAQRAPDVMLVDLGLPDLPGLAVITYSADVLNVPYTVPAFTTLDLRARVRFGRSTLRVGLDNATDANGISGYTTLQVFPGTVATSTAWLIRPRTASASLTYEF